MKKLFLVLLFWTLSSSFAHAVQHIYISGVATYYLDCGTYSSTWYSITAGSCYQQNANGNVWATINGFYFDSYFDVAPYYTAGTVAQNMAGNINIYFGASIATVVILDPEDNPYPHWARIDIDDSTIPITISSYGAYLYNPNYAENNPWEISTSPLYGFI